MECCEETSTFSIPIFDVMNHRKTATVLFNHKARSADELSLKVGDIIEIVSRDCMTTGAHGWWLGRVKGHTTYGLFPFNYVTLLNDQ